VPSQSLSFGLAVASPNSLFRRETGASPLCLVPYVYAFAIRVDAGIYRIVHHDDELVTDLSESGSNLTNNHKKTPVSLQYGRFICIFAANHKKHETFYIITIRTFPFSRMLRRKTGKEYVDNSQSEVHGYGREC